MSVRKNHKKDKAQLSKLGQLLQSRNISQVRFIEMIYEKFEVTYTPCHISLHVNKKRDFMTTDTAKIFARTLDVPMEDIC